MKPWWRRIPNAYRFYRQFGPRWWAFRIAVRIAYTVRPEERRP